MHVFFFDLVSCMSSFSQVIFLDFLHNLVRPLAIPFPQLLSALRRQQPPALTATQRRGNPTPCKNCFGIFQRTPVVFFFSEEADFGWHDLWYRLYMTLTVLSFNNMYSFMSVKVYLHHVGPGIVALGFYSISSFTHSFASSWCSLNTWLGMWAGLVTTAYLGPAHGAWRLWLLQTWTSVWKTQGWKQSLLFEWGSGGWAQKSRLESITFVAMDEWIIGVG